MHLQHDARMYRQFRRRIVFQSDLNKVGKCVRTKHKNIRLRFIKKKSGDPND